MILLIDFQSPIFFVLYILLGFGVIALIAFLCRKYIPGLKQDKTEIDEKKSSGRRIKPYFSPNGQRKR